MEELPIPPSEKDGVGTGEAFTMSEEWRKNMKYFDCSPLVVRMTAQVITAVKHGHGGTIDREEDLRKYVKSLVLPVLCLLLTRRGTPLSRAFLQRLSTNFAQMGEAIYSHFGKLNEEQTFLKYWLGVFHCQVFHDDQRPERDSCCGGKPLFSGFLRRLIARRVVRRDLSFIYSLSKGSKLAWPELCEAKRLAALKKHRKALAHHWTGTGFDAHLEQTILAASHEVFGSVGDSPVKLCPSSSACLQASRREGGALGTVEKLTLSETELGDLRGLVWNIEGFRKTRLAQFYERLLDEMEAGHIIAPTSRTRARSPRTARFESEYFSKVGPNDLVIVAIPEPGKFRIISKGNGNLYTVLQPLQGEMLSAWKQTPWSSMFHDDLTAKVNEIDQNCKEDLWCSVDYESATDLLHRRATLLALTGCSQAIDYDLARWSFSMGIGWYPELDDDDTKVQGSLRVGAGDGSLVGTLLAEGQPMGHPLSFQLLCTINLAVFREAVYRWETMKLAACVAYPQREFIRKRARAMRENVLVNGDDMLFKCPPEFRDIFYRTAAEVGFKISVGKNYISPDMCMMNSQVFQRRRGKMIRVGYLNQRLTSGLNVKKGDGLSTATPTQLGKDISKMVRLAPWTMPAVPLCFERFKSDWHGFRPNWYLPVHLGGYGLDWDLRPPWLKVTQEQRRVASYFIAHPHAALYAKERAAGEEFIHLSGELVGRTRWVLGDYCLTQSESFSDDWLLKQCLANRFAGLRADDDEVPYAQQIRKDYRLKPVSMQRLQEYFHARPITSFAGVPAPPPSLLFNPPLRKKLSERGYDIDLPLDGGLGNSFGAWGLPIARTRQHESYRDFVTRLAEEFPLVPPELSDDSRSVGSYSGSDTSADEW